MVAAIGDAVTRSDNIGLTGTLKPKEEATGGFAETGVSGKHFNGGTILTVAPNGAPTDPRGKAPAEILLPPDADTKAHVHPSGQIGRTTGDAGTLVVGDSQNSSFVQTPSPRDIENALPYGTNIVVGGAGEDRTVYFYARSGNQSGCNCIAKMSWSNFLKLK